MVEVKRFDIGSVAKIMGVTYAIFGFIIGAFITLISVVGLAASAGTGGGIIGLFFGIAAIVFLPIFYGILGFVFGAIGAAIYNVVASRMGGVKFES